MQTEHAFAVDDVFPSWFVNALSQFVSTHAQLRLEQQDNTTVRVVAGANDAAAVLAIQGRWRWVEATVVRAHPGGAAGTYPIFATAKETPADPTTTDYSFGLAIVAPGATPTIVAGTVDLYRHIGDAIWDGAKITRVDQVTPPRVPHRASHEPGGDDSLIALTDASFAAANKDGAAGTPSLRTLGNGAQQSAAGNDARLSDARAPTSHHATHQPGGADEIVGLTDENIAAANKDGAAGTASLRTLGGGGQQAAPGNDARLSNARTPTAHKATHEPGGADPLTALTDANVAAANKDGGAGTPSMRTLGTGAQQAAPGTGAPPVGAIMAYAGTGDPPVGTWVVADGRLIDRTAFAPFFNVAGHAYNAGVDPGNNKVKIPDKRGRKSIGAINMGTTAGANDNGHSQAARGASGGEVTHQNVASEMPGHYHGVSDPSHAHGVYDPGHAHGGPSGTLSHAQAYPTSIAGGHTDVVFSNNAGSGGTNGAYTSVGIYGAGTGISTISAGGDGAHNNLDPYEADAYLVRVA